MAERNRTTAEETMRGIIATEAVVLVMAIAAFALIFAFART